MPLKMSEWTVERLLDHPPLHAVLGITDNNRLSALLNTVVSSSSEGEMKQRALPLVNGWARDAGTREQLLRGLHTLWVLRRWHPLEFEDGVRMAIVALPKDFVRGS